MDTKLTLKLNREVIEKAKRYTTEKKLSLSRVIENYLSALTSDKANEDFQISAFVKSISSGVEIPADYDYRKDRANDFDEKYK